MTSTLNRRDFEVSLDLRPPPLMRVFDQEVLGRQIKHVIEPHITYNRVAGMDNFQNVIRFDARDILSDTNEVEFGVINRIYGKRTAPKGEAGCQPQRPVFKPGMLAGNPGRTAARHRHRSAQVRGPGIGNPRTAYLGDQADSTFSTRPSATQSSLDNATW